MRGVYARFRCVDVPSVYDLQKWCGASFVMCAHADIRGGTMIEVATRTGIAHTNRVDLETFDVHAVEFFEDSLRAAGGVSIFQGAVVDREPQSLKWRAAMGFLTHVLDDVDVSHPRAIHASREFDRFVT